MTIKKLAISTAVLATSYICISTSVYAQWVPCDMEELCTETPKIYNDPTVPGSPFYEDYFAPEPYIDPYVPPEPDFDEVDSPLICPMFILAPDGNSVINIMGMSPEQADALIRLIAAARHTLTSDSPVFPVSTVQIQRLGSNGDTITENIPALEIISAAGGNQIITGDAGVNSDGSPRAGVYDPASNTIVISNILTGYSTVGNTLIHEFIHAWAHEQNSDQSTGFVLHVNLGGTDQAWVDQSSNDYMNNAGIPADQDLRSDNNNNNSNGC